MLNLTQEEHKELSSIKAESERLWKQLEDLGERGMAILDTHLTNASAADYREAAELSMRGYPNFEYARLARALERKEQSNEK
jgi:hypothetical protein